MMESKKHKPTLDEKIERMGFVLDFYLKIYNTTDLKSLDTKFKVLELLKFIHPGYGDAFLNTLSYNFCEETREYIRAIERDISYQIFSTLFKYNLPKKFSSKVDKTLPSEMLPNIWVGLCLSFMDLYNKKVKGIETSFFNTGKPDIWKIAKEARSISFYHELPTKELNNFENLMNKGFFEYKNMYPLVMRNEAFKYDNSIRPIDKLSNSNYLKAKKYFENALKFFNESKTLKNHQDLIGAIIELLEQGVNFPDEKKEFPSNYKSDPVTALNSFISLCELSHKKLVKNYKEMNMHLKKTFSLNKDLTYKEYEKIYEKLKNFEFEFEKKNLAGKNTIISNPWIYCGYHYAIKKKFLKLIKILEEKKSSEFNKLISKLYTRYVTEGLGGYKQYGNKNQRRKLHYLKKALKFDKNNLEAYCKLARYYETQHNEKKALENWNSLIHCYFVEGVKDNFIKSKTSNNEVGKINLSYFFDDLIIKRSKEDMSKEYKLTKLIYDLCPDKGLVSKPVAYIQEMKGYNYLIIRPEERAICIQDSLKISRSPQDPVLTLAESMRWADLLCILKFNKSVLKKLSWTSKKEILDNFKTEYFKKVIDSLVKIQNLGKNLESYVDQYDYGTKLKIKLEELFPENKNKIYKDCSFLIDYLNSLPSHFGHCDFNANNILATNGTFCIIDYEKTSLVNKYFDLVYLLEQAQLDVSYKVKKSLVQYLRNKIKDKAPIEEVMKIYDYNALFINLSLAGTCSKWAYKGEEYKKHKQKYLTQAKGILRRIEKNCGLELNYLKNTLNN